MDDFKFVSSMVEKASAAQKVFETYSQEQVDRIVGAVAKVVFDNAEPLSKMVVEETGMGSVQNKITKHLSKARIMWYRMKDVKSRGIIRYLDDSGLVEMAKPIGVIGSVTPVTNPTTSVLHNVMVALKCGNSIVISPHPHTKKCCKYTVDLMNAELDKLGAPTNLIQIVEEPTIEISKLVMQLTDVCISTGGPGVVGEAYKSGKPAYGVGQGNIQVLVDRDVDIPDAVSKILTGRTFDKGILCTCEQSAICPEELAGQILDEFTKQGAYWASDQEQVSALRDVLFPEGALNKKMVGKDASMIAKAAGFDVPEDTHALIVKPDGWGDADVFSKEKLFPVLAFYTYATWEQAVEIAAANLEIEGKGHSIVIHSNNNKNVEYAAERLCVCRFAVNVTGSNCLGGSFTGGLNPTLTLGCGSWGNNSISENLWVHHMYNLSRISYPIPNAHIPSDEEIWR